MRDQTLKMPLGLNANRCFWAATVTALASALSVGCATRPLPYRPSVQELIQDAVNESNEARQGSEIAIIENCIDAAAEPFGEPTEVVISDQYTLAAPEDISEPRVTEEWVETDVRETLLVMTSDADADLVMDDNITGVVNTSINDLPLSKAIEKVLMPLGYVYVKKGNQYIVAPPDPSSPLFSHIATQMEYRPKHLEATTLLATVPPHMSKFAQPVEGANIILVDAPREICDDLVSRFGRIDQPVPQVVLEAIICVVSPDSGFQFGLDWQHAVQLNGETALQLGATGLALNGNFSPTGLNAVFSDFSSTSTFIKMLCEHGYLTIRASPHVMAKDGEKANISINRETFFSVQPSSSGTGNDAFFVQPDIQKVDAGITLEITPRIRGDVVTIEIDRAEVSEDIRSASTELALNPFPIINRRSVSTTVHVKDGKTIVIGGLVQRETVDRVNRVPGLSRIPGMGYLFETKQRQTREAEVVIFISPRIVKPPGSME